MRYEKGTFIVVPNAPKLNGLPSEMQSIYIWLCHYADKDGMCFPARRTLARVSGCSVKTLDKYMAKLIEFGFIRKEIRRKEGSKQNLSNTYQLLQLQDKEVIALEENTGRYEIGEVQEMPPGGIKNAITPSSKNDTVTISNLNSIHLTKVTETEIKKKGQLPEVLGKTYITRLLSIYTRLFKHKFGFAPSISMPRFGKLCKELIESHSELQIAAMLCVFFEWRGMTNSDEYAQKKLLDATFNPHWFGSTINQYEAYLRNVVGVDFDNEESLLAFVRDNIPK